MKTQPPLKCFITHLILLAQISSGLSNDQISIKLISKPISFLIRILRKRPSLHKKKLHFANDGNNCNIEDVADILSTVKRWHCSPVAIQQKEVKVYSFIADVKTLITTITVCVSQLGDDFCPTLYINACGCCGLQKTCVC